MQKILYVLGIKRLPVFEYGVNDNQQLAHRGGDGHKLGLAASDQTRIIFVKRAFFHWFRTFAAASRICRASVDNLRDFPGSPGLVHDPFLLIDNDDVMLEFADIAAGEKLTISHDELHG